MQPHLTPQATRCPRCDFVCGRHFRPYRSRRLIKILPVRYAPPEDPQWRQSAYLRMLYVLDYLSGMTDSYAVSLFKKLKGISL